VVPVGVIVLQVGRRGGAVGERGAPGEHRGAQRGAAAAVPHRGRGGRGVARHGVAGVGAVLQGHVAVLVELLEFGPAVLEPDLHLQPKRTEQRVSGHVPR